MANPIIGQFIIILQLTPPGEVHAEKPGNMPAQILLTGYL